MDALTAFFKDNKVVISKHIAIAQDPIYSELGFKVVCASPFRKGDVVCSIPKTAILSTKNTAIASDLPTPTSKAEHHILLAVSLLYERSLGLRSPWHGYIATLPFSQPNGIHILPSSCIGTSLFYTLSAYMVDIHAGLTRLSPHLHTQGIHFTHREILDTLSLVTSRAFNIDAFHHDAFVPLADLFNHKSNAEHCHIQSDQEVCTYCGFKFCDCLTDDESAPNSTNEKQESEWSDEESEHMSVTDNDEDMLDMIAVKPCKRDREVFNTFGQHSNAQLLTLYGFIEKSNPNDEAIVHEQELRSVVGGNVYERAKALYLKWENEIMDYAETVRESNVCDLSEDKMLADGGAIDEKVVEAVSLSEDVLIFQIREGSAPPLRFFLAACVMSLEQQASATKTFKLFLQASKQYSKTSQSIVARIVTKRQDGPALEPMIQFIKDYELKELKMFAKSLERKMK